MIALLFHGRGSSPEKINWLTRPFREMGFQVIAPRISEVYDGYEEGLRILNNSKEPIIVGGHSMGGTVALLLSARNPDKVSCVVAVAAPVDRVLQLKWLEKSEPGSFKRSIYEDLAKLGIDKLQETSPIRYINRNHPPIIYVRGTLDDIVPEEHLNILRSKARELGITLMELIIDGMGHTPRSSHISVISKFIKDNVPKCVKNGIQ